MTGDLTGETITAADGVEDVPREVLKAGHRLKKKFHAFHFYLLERTNP